MTNNDPSLAENTARVKSIYVELPEYEYYHSPSGINRKDEKFIGREAIIKRLKTILNNSKTRAGAYLITGYRGMGKTSLVRKVIADQKETCSFSPGWVTNYAFHCLVFLLLLSVVLFQFYVFFNAPAKYEGFDEITDNIKGLWVPALVMLAWVLLSFAIYQLFHLLSNAKTKATIPVIGWIVLIVVTIGSGIFLHTTFPTATELGLSKTGDLNTIYEYSFIQLPSFFPPISFWLMSILIYGGIIFSERFPNREFVSKWWKWVIPKSSKHQTLSVEISLSQDDIGEKDFLRLLAKKIHLAFENFNRPVYSFLKFLIRGNKYMLFFLGFFVFYSSISRFYFEIPEKQTKQILGVSEARGDVEGEVIFKKAEEIDEVPKKGTKESKAYTIWRLSKPEAIGQVTNDENFLGYELKGGSGENVTYSPLEKSIFFNQQLWPVLFVVLGLLYYLLVNLLIRGNRRLKRHLGIPSYQTIRRRLDALVSKIEANIVLEQSQSGSAEVPKAGISFTRRKTQHFPIAGPKEIEFELIDILNAIDETPFFWKSVPRFICVFDELDKIHLTHFPDPITGKEESSFSLNNDAAHSGMLRSRREKISNILANLKHFLNVAKAKFIFIAGREMFDASLADVSDRDFFLGSIFHDIIYVESFLKDKTGPNSHGITNMVEAYLCKLLMGKDSDKKSLTLKDFYQSQAIRDDSSQKKSKSEFPSKDPKEILKLQKATATLQNFIIYLIYRSNGTPKKLTQLIENQIVEISQEEATKKFSSQNILILRKKSGFEDIRAEILKNNSAKGAKVKKKKSSFFLYFGHQDQYQFGLTSYLYRPYLIASSQFTKSFGDKLLFSTSFIVDHLFKFHPWAFSWKTLELTPEVVFANTSPELRTYIGRLVAFLLQSQMREIVYGVFEFKFFNKIRSEIAYISKIKEEESAAYNFTLDESQQVKRHFRKRLNKLIDQGRLHPSRKEGEYHHSIAFIHTTLGDLHFYDQEFDEALVEYSEAVAIQSRTFPDKVTPHQLTNWMKDRLKVGLVYERMRANDDAFAKYEGLLMDMEHFFQRDSSSESQEERTEFAKSLFENLRFFQLPFLARLVMIEKEGISGVSYYDIFQSEARMKEFLTKCLEVTNKGSGNWSFFNKGQPETQEFLVRSYYHLNVGAVLYFKNGAVLHAPKEIRNGDIALWDSLKNQLVLEMEEGFPDPGYKVPRSATIEYYKAFLFLAGRIQALSPERGYNIRNKKDPSPLNVEDDTLKWVTKRLNKDLTDLTGDSTSEQELKAILEWMGKALTNTSSVKQSTSPIHLVIAVSTWFYLLPSRQANFINKDKNLRSTIAQVLSKFGDTLLCYQGKEVKFDFDKWKALFHVKDVLLNQKDSTEELTEFSSDNTHSLNDYLKDNMKLEKGENLLYHTCYFHLLSGLYYQSAGKHQSHELQLRKVLYVIKEYLTFGLENNGPSADGPQFLDLLKKHLFTPAIQAITKTNNIATRPQIFKFKSTFGFEQGKESTKSESRTIYQFLSNYPESRELSLLMAEIEFKLHSKGFGIQKLSFNSESHPVNPYNTIASKFVRMQELNFKASWNFEKIRHASTRIKKLSESSLNILHQEIFESLSNGEVPEKKGKEVKIDHEEIKNAILIIKEWCEGKDLEFGDYIRPIIFDFLSNDTGKEADLDGIVENWKKNFENPQLNKFFQRFSLSRVDLLHFAYSRNHPKSNPNNFPTAQFEYYLIDSLFCLTELVKIQKIFGQNYITSYSYLGYAHAKLGDWCLIYQAYISYLLAKDPEEEDKKELKRFEETLKAHIETTNLAYLEPKYHYEKAVMAFKSAVEMHNNGNAYYQQLQTMHFLEDDFNDNMYHFTAAMERYKLNLGAIRKKIEVLSSFMNLSKTYQFESYINTEEPPQK